MSALVRRFAATIAVLAIAGTFVPGAAVGATAKPTLITNFPLHTEFPNDPFYVDEWGLQSIGAPNAWGVTLGSSSVVVAVVDTGVWWTHPDIRGNMWTDPNDGSHGHDYVDGDTNPMDVDTSPQPVY